MTLLLTALCLPGKALAETDAMAAFAALEARLLEAEAVDVEFDIRAAGALEAALGGEAAVSRAGVTTNHTRLACETICSVTPEEAALLSTNALEDLAADDELPAYEHWRARIRNRWAAPDTWNTGGQLSHGHQVKHSETEVARGLTGGMPYRHERQLPE